MRLLLDTHAAIRLIGGNEKLSASATAAIRNTSNSLTINIASFWEMAIKLNLGNLHLHAPFEQFITAALEDYGMNLEPVTLAHTQLIATRPRHHKDPFDRMIAAQSLLGGFHLVSADPIFDQYGTSRLW